LGGVCYFSSSVWGKMAIASLKQRKEGRGKKGKGERKEGRMFAPVNNKRQEEKRKKNDIGRELCFLRKKTT